MTGLRGRLEWAVAARPLPGESESGDIHFVAATAAGWLLAVADGLGHGPGAARASRALLEVLAGHGEEPLEQLMQRCHERLRTTRGTALSLAAIDAAAGALTWVGVGNVEGVLLHPGAPAAPAQYITQRGGIVGYRLPALQPATLPIGGDDLLLLATDGIREEFSEGPAAGLPPAALADRILARYARPDDDALVLAARWCPPGPAEACP